MDYDVIVVGGGHAGIEAALAAARLGRSTLLVTQNPDAIGRMSCNPAIGGLSKGNLVREVDALGGQMGLLIDATTIQYRLLNRSRGPAVQAPRAQADKSAYAAAARSSVEGQRGLRVYMDAVTGLVASADGARVEGVITERGRRIGARAVVIASGTFMEGRIFIGEHRAAAGRLGEPAALGLGSWLRAAGFPVGRMKTGTPARVKASSVDLGALELQAGDPDRKPFSFLNDEATGPELPCRITYTNERTHAIIRANIGRSPLFSGDITGKGPRYCPSIEDKVVKFPDRDRHQIFVEPEGLYTDELYLNGLSSSLPEEVQDEFIRTMPGFDEAFMVRPGYAVEYDYVDPVDLYASLESKRMAGLYMAGQTNGTSGYEEAAAQGIVAGINAALAIAGEPPLILSRAESYIGVMIDDIVTLGAKEPYRMFTSRAERRLALRHDTADRRLTPVGMRVGLASTERAERFGRKLEAMDAIRALLGARRISQEDAARDPVFAPHVGEGLSRALRDPRVAEMDVEAIEPGAGAYPEEWVTGVILDLRYEGYVAKEGRLSARLGKLDATRLAADFDYSTVPGLSSESVEKLLACRPLSLGQASRIPGVRPSDVALLAVRIAARR
ncbi:MAG: tRNA uridine-5-carboxymethylaminomethyl(34) synthesis enzyme MnmG [Spirochaetae bacterium HGW-Spirochaetae-3]|jgi:tRNA uridine 5-carboxymethylaminomethyl modification enzyme|nr:MAG: tRNA uridine-5-carboxymethylaminomethyl(34) synthesis enzyme MnmG [Spirochaetae bacterium HGW-Spirochaetae-3]